MVGGMVDIEFRGKGMSYMVDLGVVWKLMVDFLIPVNNVQMPICDNLVSVMKNVFCGRGWGMVDIEFRGKGMSYMIDLGVVWKLMVDFLIPVNNVQMPICDNLVSVMKNVFCGRGLGVWSNPQWKKIWGLAIFWLPMVLWTTVQSFMLWSGSEIFLQLPTGLISSNPMRLDNDNLAIAF
jgi:hypothetical protein